MWIYKTEPETYSFEQLLKGGKTNWNGVRNFQARNFLKQAQTGDEVVIYHSGKEKSAVGLAKVIRAAYEDMDLDQPGDWVQVDIKAIRKFAKPISLTAMKADKVLKEMQLVRQSRLSVSPLTKKEFSQILSLSEK